MSYKWQPWKGGNRPCNFWDTVEVNTRRGNIKQGVAGMQRFKWKAEPHPEDVVAWRVIKYRSKYVTMFVVQGLYPGGNGWEDLCQSESWGDAMDDLKAYKENEVGTSHRWIRRKELRKPESE